MPVSGTGVGRRLPGKSWTAEASGSFDGFWVTSDLQDIIIKMHIKIYQGVPEHVQCTMHWVISLILSSVKLVILPVVKPVLWKTEPQNSQGEFVGHSLGKQQAESPKPGGLLLL